MLKLLNSRHSILLSILFFYLFPLFVLNGYALAIIGPEKGWKLFSFGLFLAFCGSFFLSWAFRFNRPLEKKQPEPPQIITINNETEILELRDIIQSKNEELLRQQSNFERDFEQQRLEMEHQYRTLQDLAEQKITQLISTQQVIQDQQNAIDKKHQLINQLETKVSDLNYEIKTLIQVTEYPETSKIAEPSQSVIDEEMELDSPIDILPQVEKMIHTAEEATTQLKRCINIAQKITRPSYYGDPNSRFLSLDNHALDLRHLFDNLRSEHNSTILFFSQKENRLLFINNQIKHILGWSPEKMIQNFEDITQPSLQEWRKGITQLNSTNEARINLLLKSKMGQEINVQAILGIVPTGLFRNHVMGVLYQSSATSSFK